jgi:hypothetical protein
MGGERHRACLPVPRRVESLANLQAKVRSCDDKSECERIRAKRASDEPWTAFSFRAVFVLFVVVVAPGIGNQERRWSRLLV